MERRVRERESRPPKSREHVKDVIRFLMKDWRLRGGEDGRIVDDRWTHCLKDIQKIKVSGRHGPHAAMRVDVGRWLRGGGIVMKGSGDGVVVIM
jgi:hypothetical protein